MIRRNTESDGGTALFALGVLIVITAGWWALALWPAGDAPPAWLERARWVCFNADTNGLPDASGWLLLIGQPLGMLGILMTVWGDQVKTGLRWAVRSRVGLASIAVCAGLVALGVVASGLRVLDVAGTNNPEFAEAPLPDTYPRLDRVAPELSLVDQTGERLTLESLHGRPALVTFAFGNCATVCPAVVKQVATVQQRLRERAVLGELAPESVPRVVVVSLDPWRDTPSRLDHLTSHWELGAEAHILTGEVAEVEAVLDAWNVARRRDPETGDVTHPALVYILDAEGAIAYATRGGTEAVLELLGRV